MYIVINIIIIITARILFLCMNSLSIILSSQVNCICIALNHSYRLKWLYRPFDDGPYDYDYDYDMTSHENPTYS